MADEAGSRRDLLIGIGNRLRGDDGVGLVLVDELAAEWMSWSMPWAELKAVHQLTPELAEAVALCGRVLFVDACVSTPRRGPWIEPLLPEDGPAEAPRAGTLGGHQLEPVTLMALARLLYGWQGEGALLRVPAFAFPHGMDLSAPLRQALPEARRVLRGWLRDG